MGKKNSALVFDFGIDTKRYVIISEELFKELLGKECSIDGCKSMG